MRVYQNAIALAQMALTIPTVQTCECCLRSWPESECVEVNWWLRTVNRLPAPLGATPVCNECVGRVRRTGYFAVLGLVMLSIFALVMLGLTNDLVNLVDRIGAE